MNRGRGDAPLTWGDESDLENTKFKETVLPPGYLDQPKDEVIGVTKTAPDVDPAESAPRSSRRKVDPASGKETWNRKLRPRHRNVVRKYFNSSKD